MVQVYEENFKVFQFECDPWDNMTPGAILRRVQEIGTVQCEQLGLNEQLYKQTNTVWILSRVSLEIYTVPKWGQNLRIETRAYGMNRAVFQRVTTIYDEHNNKLCETDASWVLVDTTTKRILRNVPSAFPNPFTAEQGAERHLCKQPRRIEAEYLKTMQADYSFCDRNGHLNNTRYADIVCDALPVQLLQACPITKVLLFYRSEIPLGTEFELFSKQIDETEYYFSAQDAQGHKYFESVVSF